MGRLPAVRPFFTALALTGAALAGCAEAFRFGVAISATPPGLKFTFSHAAAASTQTAPATEPAASLTSALNTGDEK